MAENSGKESIRGIYRCIENPSVSFSKNQQQQKEAEPECAEEEGEKLVFSDEEIRKGIHCLLKLLFCLEFDIIGVDLI